MQSLRNFIGEKSFLGVFLFMFLSPSAVCCQKVLQSQVIQAHVEASYITVETTSFYGVQTRPESVQVNGQEAAFSYTDNKVHNIPILVDALLLKNMLTSDRLVF